MCLDTKYKEKSIEKYVEKYADKRGYIIVYKIVAISKYDGYKAAVKICRYNSGINVATGGLIGWSNILYQAGFHFYTTERRARVSLQRRGSPWERAKLIRCRIHKSWITAMGRDGYVGGETVVTKKAIFPSPKNKKAIVKRK